MKNSLCLAYSPNRIKVFIAGLERLEHLLNLIWEARAYDDCSGESIDYPKLVELQERLKLELNEFLRDHACLVVSLSSLDHMKAWKDMVERVSEDDRAIDSVDPPEYGRELIKAREQVRKWEHTVEGQQTWTRYASNHVRQNWLPYSISFLLGLITNLLTSYIYSFLQSLY